VTSSEGGKKEKSSTDEMRAIAKNQTTIKKGRTKKRVLDEKVGIIFWSGYGERVEGKKEESLRGAKRWEREKFET